MPNLNDLSIKVRNFKCFADEPQGFEAIRKINVIVGRNNSGKSTLLDLVEYVCTPYNMDKLGHKGATPEITLSHPLTLQEIQRVFSPGTRGGYIPGGGDHFQYGSKWIGKRLWWVLRSDKQNTYKDLENKEHFVNRAEYFSQLATSKENPLKGLKFKRLHANRDITPETGDFNSVEVKANGDGATTTINTYLNNADFPRHLVEKDFLDALNEIYQPDSKFSRIITRIRDDKWEIEIEFDGGVLIPLSHTGSGFKTVISVLIYLILLPAAEKLSPENYIFAFEELENNLHPALQRRLLEYIKRYSREKNAHFFLTTHSSIAIDLVSRDKDCQIIHVSHADGQSEAKHVKTYIEKTGVIDDLDIRASDLLMANSIVWVEGPSDRIYFNKWIQLVSNGSIQEGLHYQCMYYGGRLLAHLSADVQEEDIEEKIQILKINRNVVVLMDSDKKTEGSDINATKKRVIDELNKLGGVAWVTAGREIENYIPIRILEELFIDYKSEMYGQFKDVPESLGNLKTRNGKNQKIYNKIWLAQEVAARYKKEDVSENQELVAQLQAIIQKLTKWSSGQVQKESNVVG